MFALLKRAAPGAAVKVCPRARAHPERCEGLRGMEFIEDVVANWFGRIWGNFLPAEGPAKERNSKGTVHEPMRDGNQGSVASAACFGPGLPRLQVGALSARVCVHESRWRA